MLNHKRGYNYSRISDVEAIDWADKPDEFMKTFILSLNYALRGTLGIFRRNFELAPVKFILRGL